MPQTQKGASLLVVLLLLVAMLIASAALLRSSETTTLIAGNVAFKEAATQNAEVAFGEAEAYLNALANADTTVAFHYYATPLAQDANGLPAGLDWSQVAAVAEGAYTHQYVIERMCNAPLPVANTVAQCQVLLSQTAGSNRSGSPIYEGAPAVYFRVTARVTGPKNAESFVQASYSR